MLGAVVTLACLAACHQVFGTEANLSDAQAMVCPAEYGPVAGAPHLYRFAEGPATWQGAAADCRDDAEGITHLATYANGSELVQVNLAAPFPREGDPLRWEAYVGYARAVDSPAPLERAEFRAVTGELAPDSLWQDGEPNNAADMKETVGIVGSDLGGLVDGRPNKGLSFICSCDLQPVRLDVVVE